MCELQHFDGILVIPVSPQAVRVYHDVQAVGGTVPAGLAQRA
eukprot:CAMPEP_0179153750 /NCGR_PEP_ID=MMETSP0796-20121207/74785_1 /TAXON_ID=73915 /ORGANISM="Pyrodinium bahamense, Strain pbaha01" /LENGTH=41 /DNA_ID= /DNA_START= /DNA_END= /DNA_ORIENTATION=